MAVGANDPERRRATAGDQRVALERERDAARRCKHVPSACEQQGGLGGHVRLPVGNDLVRIDTATRHEHGWIHGEWITHAGNSPFAVRALAADDRDPGLGVQPRERRRPLPIRARSSPRKAAGEQ
jgi:hypothetical protein